MHIPDVTYTFIELDIHTEVGKVSIQQRGQEIIYSKIITEPSYHTFDILQHSSRNKTEWQDCPTRAIRELIDALNNDGQLSCSIKEGLMVSEICNDILGS